MAVLKIVTVPDAILRRKAHKITEFDKSFQTFVDYMIDTLRASRGVGRG